MSLFQCQAIRGRIRELIPAHSSSSCAVSAPPFSPEIAETAAPGAYGRHAFGSLAK